MATATQDDFTATGDWSELTATITGAASVDTVIQCLDAIGTVDVVFGGASAPEDATGIRLWPGDSVQGNAANIWVRGNDGSAVVSTTLL